ncbi:MAG: undecaprenyl-diphosphate phosphatase [Deltaproteobacteria bacterium]|jgi:undecaprenyl-diphosphatase|nr:undecaprenyl-diphosphate phosphatase [Deltaproteobacteria bacterium]MBW2531118.1 undecaprenyl-diphosphate phosphatase [Deltaproteobacteria bacterium]
MNPLDAVWLGVVEGLTEFLPVSSTGHLILLGDWLGHEGEAAKALDIVIQLGAVVAVVVYFRRRLGEVAQGLVRREPASLRLGGALLAAFVPTAIVGLLLHRLVKQHLFGPVPVAAALILGGIVMVAVEAARRRRGTPGREGLEHVTVAIGFWIGLCQCVSLWPGSSRSMVTIVGGQLAGLDTKTAAEFSFLLAIPTLGAATVFDLVRSGHHIIAEPGGLQALLVGLAVSFVVSWGVIAAFLRFVGRLGLSPFGVYRVLLGGAVLYWA